MNPTPRSRYRLLLRASLAALPVSLIFPLVQTAQAAVNTPTTFTTSTSLLTAGNWSAGLPDSTKDALFIPGSLTTTGLTITSGNLTVGSLSDTKAFGTVTITNGATSGGSTSTLTLGGAGGTNSTSGALSTDLIYVVTGSSTVLNLNGGASFGLNLVLGQAGSFNVGGSSTLNIGTSGTASTLDNGGFALTVTGAGATNIGSAISGSGALTKAGSGTLTLSGTNAYTGTTGITGGTLTLTGSINSGSALALGGNATLNYTPTVGSSTQTFNGTTVNAGFSTVTNATSGNTVALGAITRNTGGILNVSSLTGTTTTSTAVDSTGILGTWATIGTGTGLKYAAGGSGGAITGYTGTAAATAAGVTDTTGVGNYDVAAVGALGAGASFNTLRYTGAAGTITNNFTANGLMNAGTGTVTYSGNVTIGANKELVIVGNTQGITISGNIVDNGGGASSLVYGGPSAGTLVLSGANNTYSGGTIINSGTVDVRNSNAVGTGGINLAGAGGTLAVNTGVSVTLSANITGQGKVSTGNSAAILTLTGNNDFTGGVTVNGTVVMGTGSNNGLGTGTITLSQSTLRSSDNNSRTIANAISMSSNAMTFGAIQDAVTGLGDLNFTYTGATVSVGGAKTWTVNNSTTATFANNWNGNAGFNITKAGTGTLVFNGNLSNGASNVVVSAGKFILNGAANGYTGTTTINGGTMLVNGSLSGSSAVTVNTGGRIGGLGSVGAVSFASGAALAYEVATAAQGGDGLTTTGFTGSGVGSFTIYLSGAATGFDANSNYSWAVLTSNSTDMSSVSLSGINLDTTGFGQAFGGTFTLSKDATSIFVNYSAVPEPSTYAVLAGLGVLGLAALRRRRAGV